jgi:hypothetical protein
VTLGTLNKIFRHPVKSMGGESLNSASVQENGIPGDRAWAVRDEERGGIRGGKRFAQLMNCAARYLEEPAAKGSSPAQITLPGGKEIMTTDDGVADKLTDAIGSPVTMWPLLPADALEHYKRGAPLHEDMEKEWRTVFAREPDEPLPDLGAFPEELMTYESPLGTYFDAFPIMVMTQQSLDRMAAVAPEGVFDVRRFRPNFLLDAASNDPFPEQGWIGREISIGEVQLKIELTCPRCVMTTHGFADLPKQPAIMRALVKHAEGNLGVYASVTKPGTVHAGDPVAFAD